MGPCGPRAQLGLRPHETPPPCQPGGDGTEWACLSGHALAGGPPGERNHKPGWTAAKQKRARRATLCYAFARVGILTHLRCVWAGIRSLCSVEGKSNFSFIVLVVQMSAGETDGQSPARLSKKLRGATGDVGEGCSTGENEPRPRRSVLIWDLDETLIVFNSILDRSFEPVDDPATNRYGSFRQAHFVGLGTSTAVWSRQERLTSS